MYTHLCHLQRKPFSDVDGRLGDGVWVALRHLLDVHSALGRGNQNRTLQSIHQLEQDPTINTSIRTGPYNQYINQNRTLQSIHQSEQDPTINISIRTGPYNQYINQNRTLQSIHQSEQDPSINTSIRTGHYNQYINQNRTL